MSIDFPASPVDQQLFTTAGNGVVYKYSAAYSSWLAQNPAPPLGGTGDFYATVGGTPQAITSTQTVYVFGSVTGGNSGAWYNAATGRYTPPAGRYSIFAAITGLNASAGTSVSLTLRKNGTDILFGTGNGPTTAGYRTQAVVEGNFDANGSDYFEITVSASNGASTSTGYAWFGAFPLTGMQGPTGPAGVTQTVFFETGAVATGTTTMPFADTIPTNTQGDQYMQLAITPQSATSKLIIEVIWMGANSIQNNMFLALYQDNTVNALAVTVQATVAANSPVTIPLRHVMTSGTTSATTFKVRCGANAASGTTFNGSNAARLSGGVMASSIVIREVP